MVRPCLTTANGQEETWEGHGVDLDVQLKMAKWLHMEFFLPETSLKRHFFSTVGRRLALNLPIIIGKVDSLEYSLNTSKENEFKTAMPCPTLTKNKNKKKISVWQTLIKKIIFGVPHFSRNPRRLILIKGNKPRKRKAFDPEKEDV